MKKIKITQLILIILINMIFTTGCWNYREVDRLSIVAGVAIDKGLNNHYKMTAEIIQITSGKEGKMISKTVSAEGMTMFDAARNIISLSGKSLYWSHAQIIILSKEIASEGVTKTIDWYNRDSETRTDVYILVSEEASAKEIFEGQGTTEEIKSFVLGDMMKNQKSISKAPINNMIQFDIESKTKGNSTIIPAVNLKQTDGRMIPQIMGSAIIKNDKLAGFLDGEETKDLVFIRNDVKGGVLIEKMQTSEVPTFVSLEIFKNKTKVTPVIYGNDIEINVNTDTTVAIDEINGKGNFIDDEGRMKLEQSVENTLKERIEALINKMQSEYGADVFGFGTKLWEEEPQKWNSVSDNWEEVFKDLKVNVKANVHIKNSAILSKSVEEGD